ncbi:MAG TPA: chemotaxis protein CheW [Spirochaetia bacterium]|nr:chemotaxis protein CheW [Spirochaetia bacterium]
MKNDHIELISADSFSSKEENQFVIFKVGRENYGINVMEVNEIITLDNLKITEIPKAPDYVLGVVNLRGNVIPLIDLRKKLGITVNKSENEVAIIVEVKDKIMGIIVDGVNSVTAIPIADIKETPNFGSRLKTDFIKGLGKYNDELVIIVDIDKVLTAAEFELLAENLN